MKTASALHRAKASTHLERSKRQEADKPNAAASKNAGASKGDAASEARGRAKARNEQSPRPETVKGQKAKTKEGRPDASRAKAYGMPLASVGAGRSLAAEPFLSDVGAQLSQGASGAVHSLLGVVGAASAGPGAASNTQSHPESVGGEQRPLETVLTEAYQANKPRLQKFIEKVQGDPYAVDSVDISSRLKNSNAPQLARLIYRNEKSVGQKRVNEFAGLLDELYRAMSAKSRLLLGYAQEVNPAIELENSVVNTGSGAGKEHTDDNVAGTVAAILNGEGHTRVQLPNGEWMEVPSGNILMLGPGTRHQAWAPSLERAYSSERMSYADFLNVKANGEWERFTNPA